MTTRRITCPERGHLEVVDLERTPHGLVVTDCSGTCCNHECARRLDRRARGEAERGERVVVLFESTLDATRRAAGWLAQDLRDDGLTVELADLATGAPPLADYDAVVLGAHVRFGRPVRAAVHFVREHRDELAALPTFFFSVGRRRLDDGDDGVAWLAHSAGWRPTACARFLGEGDRPRLAVRDFAHQVAEEVPPAVIEPAFA